jgi:uncharacterized membrane protein
LSTRRSRRKTYIVLLFWIVVLTVAWGVLTKDLAIPIAVAVGFALSLAITVWILERQGRR